MTSRKALHWQHPYQVVMLGKLPYDSQLAFHFHTLLCIGYDLHYQRLILICQVYCPPHYPKASPPHFLVQIDRELFVTVVGLNEFYLLLFLHA